MRDIDPSFIADIRSASRGLVRELGFLNHTIANSELTPSAVHALVEIGRREKLSAKELSEILILEKSTISRMISGLLNKGELEQSRSSSDARNKNISLSPKGRKTLAKINEFAELQVSAALGPVDSHSRMTVLAGLQKYAQALRRIRLPNDREGLPGRLTIEKGYYSGIIGRIAEMHAGYYSDFVGFGAAFESTVASGVAEFVNRLENHRNALWSVQSGGRVLGSIAIDGEDLGPGKAHLRWFILEGEARGTGLGQKLIKKAVAFSEKAGFEEIHLWTFKGLDAARSLYEKNGFVLVDEYPGSQWGEEVMEQWFVWK